MMDRKQRRAHSGHHTQCVESLEPRQHLSVTLDGGVVHVVGTNKGDSIVVSLNASQTRLAVWENGVRNEFALGSVTGVEIRSGNGNDTVGVSSINGLIEVPLVVLAGNGDDVIVGGNTNDILNGGNGKDTISGQGGNDRLIGNNGNDVIYAGTGDDQVIGGNGKDFLFGMAGNDVFDTRDGAREIQDRQPGELLAKF